MLTRMQAQKAKDEADAAVRVAQAAVAVAKGTAVAAASKALGEALARVTAADADLAKAKVVHREKYEKVTTELPDSAAESEPASEEEAAASGPPASGAPMTEESAREGGGKMKRAEDEGDEEKALVAAFTTADKAYKAKASGTDAYALRGPVALLGAVQKALNTKGIGETFGALSALPARLAALSTVEKDVAKLKTESRAQRIDAILRAPENRGKVGGKSHRDHLRAEAMKHGSSWLRGHLAIAPVALRTVEDGGLEAKEGDDGRGQFIGAEAKEEERILTLLTADIADPKEREAFVQDFKSRLAAQSPKVPRI